MVHNAVNDADYGAKCVTERDSNDMAKLLISGEWRLNGILKIKQIAIEYCLAVLILPPSVSWI